MAKPQFFDVYGFHNFNSLFPNTNRRMNYPEYSIDDIEHILHLHQELTVIRHIFFSGTSDYGDFSIIFDDENRITGATAPNGIYNDWGIYIKSIESPDFEITNSNCSLTSILIDYAENKNKLNSEKINIVTGTNKIIDGDYTTYEQLEYQEPYPSSHTLRVLTEIELSEKTNISSIGLKYYFNRTGNLGHTSYFKLWIYRNSEWETIMTYSTSGGSSDPRYYIDTTGYNNIEKIRCTMEVYEQDFYDGRVYQIEIIEDK